VTPGGQIEDGQAPIAQADGGRLINIRATVIWPAVNERSGHASQGIAVQTTGYTTNAAHDVARPPSASHERGVKARAGSASRVRPNFTTSLLVVDESEVT
jgi:hypothetical protein